MHRRSFLQKLILAASSFGIAAIPYGVARLLMPGVNTKFSSHLRPPGALQNEKEFAKACISCSLCGEICPARCIDFDKRSGGSAAGLPFINPEKKACILCMKCTEVCPTEALTSIPREDVKMGVAQIDRSGCYPWVDKGVCGACVAVCPLGKNAIAFQFADMYRPYVKEQGCVGCGMCVEICPHPSLPIRIVEPGEGVVTQHDV
ncbi:MAG: 4Fe-4S dicluster domain-containing protein [Gammaproteobacteria bacterium]|nr:4Fe-4S dicluster domain-containing protein [Gammaproteobacteria bacterium]